MGAKQYAIKAQALCSQLEGVSHMVATFDIYAAAQTKINGEIDLYPVLGLGPFAEKSLERWKKRWSWSSNAFAVTEIFAFSGSVITPKPLGLLCQGVIWSWGLFHSASSCSSLCAVVVPVSKPAIFRVLLHFLCCCILCAAAIRDSKWYI
ncbi:hypothetical protein Tco_1341915 [Tanacetum coccineum]